MESNYSKLYAGSFIVVQLITQNLEKQGITPIVKDETERAAAQAVVDATPQAVIDAYEE